MWILYTIVYVVLVPNFTCLFCLFRYPGSVEKTLYKGPFDCIQSVYHHHGICGWFRRITPTILQEIPGFATYIASYEYMCNKFKPADQDLPSVPVMLAAGGVAGMISWVCNIPLDVVKSRMQSDDLNNPKYRNMLDCFVKSYKVEGWRVFWKGLPVICIRAFPTNAMTLAVYSYTYKTFKELNINNENKTTSESSESQKTVQTY